MRRTFPLRFVLVLACVLVFSQVAFADLYLSSGQNRFSVRVENSHFKDIRNAHGSVMVSGKNARIQVEAPGYRPSYETVYLSPNQTNYFVRVRLDDPFINVHLVDETQSFIPAAVADYYSQSLYWGDEFGVRGRLPKAGFAQLKARDIDVRINGMFAFAPRVYLTESTDYWRFEVVVRRGDMNTFSNNIRLVFPHDPVAAPTRTVGLDHLMADYRENTRQADRCRGDDREIIRNRLESLAGEIRAEFSGLDAGQQQSSPTRKREAYGTDPSPE